MQDTVEILKKMIKKSGGKNNEQDIMNIFAAAAHMEINKGNLLPYYDSTKEAIDAIKSCVGKDSIQKALKLRYERESKYDNDPKIAAKYGILTEKIEKLFNVTLDKTYIGLYKGDAPICECGNKCVFINDYEEGKRHHSGMIWYCEECGSSIGVHRGTDMPLGMPGNRQLRQKRYEAHKEIDRLIGSGLSKDSIYKILSRKMNLKRSVTHMGMFTEEQCEEALKLLKEMKGGYRL